MYRSVLVPLDGSPSSEQALPLAVSVARRAGAALEVTHVHTPFAYYRVPSAVAADVDEQARQARRAYLDGVTQRLTAQGQVKATSTLLVGHAADALHDHAVSRGADLVVMTTHGRGALSRLWLGSVADDLMRRLPMPLLLVRPQDPGLTEAGYSPPGASVAGLTEAGYSPAGTSVAGLCEAGVPAPAQSQELIPQHLLVPLDGSPLAEQILGPAGALATLLGARLTVFQAASPLTILGEDTVQAYAAAGATESTLAGLRQLQEEQQAEARSYLEGVAGRLRAQGHDVQARVVSGRHPAELILQAAREQGADLIALATRGRGGLARLLLGSVADKVVRGASVPVLVYRPRHS